VPRGVNSVIHSVLPPGRFRFTVRTASSALGAARLRFAVGGGRSWRLFKLIRDIFRTHAPGKPKVKKLRRRKRVKGSSRSYTLFSRKASLRAFRQAFRCA